MDHADGKSSSELADGLDVLSLGRSDSHLPTPPPSATILENATETPSVGPALGPKAFVETISKAYCAFLTREIVEGPIGERIRSGVRKGKAKVIVAGALPPFVTDGMLERIVDKYVIRLEDSHAANEAAIRADAEEEEMLGGRRSQTPWSKSAPSSPGLSASSLEDQPEPEVAQAHPPVPVQQEQEKTSLALLLEHKPPLCTLPVRRIMTDMFNQRMADFCVLHPDILSFIDVGALMSRDPDEGAIDRNLYACPIDPTK
jgi:hypothetical protein